MPALVVEDDPSWQGILTEILEDYGLKVDLADNLDEAIEKLRTIPYRLAVVDLSLDEQDHHNRDGVTVLRSMQQSAPDCTSILLTGYASVELAVAVIQEYGAYTCLRKETFRRVEFRKVIHQALATPALLETDTSDEHRGAKSSIESEGDRVSTTSPLGKAILVEDDSGWRNLLADLIVEAGYDVHRSASYGEARGLLQREFYQLAIIDISLASSLSPAQNQDGYLLLKSVHEANIPIIVVSGYADPELIEQAYDEHQIFAFFEKQSFDRSDFLETVSKISAITALPKLTEREMEVLAHVAQGLGNKEIAKELYITTNTVKRHLKSIYAKLDVNTRAAASASAIRMGLGKII